MSLGTFSVHLYRKWPWRPSRKHRRTPGRLPPAQRGWLVTIKTFRITRDLAAEFRDKVRRPHEFRPAWYRTLKQVGIKGLRFHDLRHEAFSRLVETGLGDQEVAAISGHKSMQMPRR